VAEEENQEAKKGKFSKKGIIIIAIVLIVAIALSIGVTLFLMGGDDSDPVSDEGSEGAETAIQKAPAIYLDIKPPILVTFNVKGRQRYMQVYVSVSSRNQASLDTMEYHMPLIRSKIITKYSGQDFDQIRTEAGKTALKEQTFNVINDVLEGEGAEKIEGVFFTNFVLQ